MSDPRTGLTSWLRRRNPRSERGGALVELAISIPIFIVILALIFDVGLGFSAARDSSSAARSAARVAALAGEDRHADYRAIDAVRAEYANSNDQILWVTIYRSSPGGDGTVPAGCGLGGGSIAGLCNAYDGATVAGLTPAMFDNDDCAGEPDVAWCPTSRSDNDGDYLGVGIWTTHEPTVGLIVPGNDYDGAYEIEDRAVFALYFPADIAD